LETRFRKYVIFSLKARLSRVGACQNAFVTHANIWCVVVIVVQPEEVGSDTSVSKLADCS